MIKVYRSREAIAERVVHMAEEIRKVCAAEPPLTVVAVLNGALPFAVDLVRELGDMPGLRFDTVSAESYKGSTSSGSLLIRSGPKTDLRDRNVLIVDDILDTGLTLRELVSYIRGLGASRVRTCVLLDKILPVPEDKKFKADWTGFRIPPIFVVGYGLDLNEEFRALPYIGYIQE